MPVGNLTISFLQNVGALAAHASNTAAAGVNAQLRAWMLAWASQWSGDPLDVNGMGAAFARADAADLYGQALASDLGSVGDAASAKLQSDYLSLQERAYRLRHGTPVRCRLMAAGRRDGQGDAAAGVFARVQAYAQDLLIAGASGFNPRKG